MSRSGQIGFIGTGVMGEPMCRNLARKSGRALLAFDRDGAPLARLAAVGVAAAESVAAVADAAMPRRPDGKTHFLRVRTSFDGSRFHVAPVGAQGSHQLSATASADGLAVLPDGEGVAEGDPVEVLLLAATATLGRSPQPSSP